MVRHEAESTVLLSDQAEAPVLAAKLSPAKHRVISYRSLEDLARAQPLSSIALLVLDFQPVPRGVLLAALGWLSLEYPSMRKVVVVEESVPLPIAKYLTACGADLVTAGEAGGGIDRLVAIVDRVYERARRAAV